MTHRRGMTIIEMLVVSTILLLLGSILAFALRPGMLAWRRGEVRSDLQGNALLGLHAITHALAEASSSSVSIFPHTRSENGHDLRTDALVVLSPYDEHANFKTSDGHPVWQSVVVYFIKPDDAQLWQATLQLTSPQLDKTAGDQLPARVTQSLENGLGVPPDVGAQRCIGRDVRQLLIENAPGTFKVAIETARDEYACNLESAVTPTLESLGGSSVSAAR